MAGPLTWRDVAAPDFRSAMQGFGQFSEMLNSALGGADKALGVWDENKTTDASKQFILDAFSKYQTPEQLAAAQADGSLMAGMDPKRLNESALEFLVNRPKDLLSMESTRLANESTKQDTAIRGTEFGWKTDDRAANDAAKPFAFQMLQSVSQPGKDGGAPTEAEISQRMSTMMSDPKFASAVSQLSPDAQANLFKNPQEVLKGALGIKQDRQQIVQSDFNMEKGRWEFQAAKADRADQLAGGAAAQAVIQGGGSDVETARGILSGMNLSPGAFAVAMNTISGTYGNVYSPDSYNQPLPGANGGGTAEGWNVAVGGTALPSNVKTMGDAFTYGRNVLIPATRNRADLGLAGTGKGSSAVGGYQITSGTMEEFGPKVFGDGWRSIQWTPQNQDKMAKAIFDSTGGSPSALKSRWTSLKKFSDAQLRGKSWQELRPIILDGESGANAGMIMAEFDDISGRQAVSEKNTKMGTEGWMKGLSDSSEPIDVAGALRTGPMKNVPEPWITSNIAKIVRDSDGKINAAQAGSILKRAMTKEAGTDLGIFNILTRGDTRDVNLGNGYRINWNQVDQEVSNGKTGRTADGARSNRNVETAFATLEQAKQNFNTAFAERTKYMREVMSNPRARNAQREAKINAMVDAALVARNRASADYNMTMKSQNQTPQNKPEADAPWYSGLFGFKPG